MFPIRVIFLWIATFSAVCSQRLFDTCGSGSTCLSSMTCTTYSPCSKGWCDKCVDSEALIFPDNGKYACFKPTYKIGEIGCKTSLDCYGFYYSYCSDASLPYVCKCLDGFQASSDGKSCDLLTPVKLGARCSSYQCGKNADCISISGNRANRDEICQCYPNYRDSGDRTNCVQYKVGDSCRPSFCKQLLSGSYLDITNNCPGATCDSGYYTCRDSYVWVDEIRTGFMSTVYTRGACVEKNATQNVALGKTCSLGWPLKAICNTGLMCFQCGESPDIGTCVSAPTSKGKALRSSTLFAAAVAMTTWIITARLR